jgi:IstB-like ATP binding protein
LAQRYERRSTIITSNLAFFEWVKVFADEKLTTALLDRLTHPAHILTTRGDSYRANKRKADVENRAPPSTKQQRMTALAADGGKNEINSDQRVI